MGLPSPLLHCFFERSFPSLKSFLQRVAASGHGDGGVKVVSATERQRAPLLVYTTISLMVRIPPFMFTPFIWKSLLPPLSVSVVCGGAEPLGSRKQKKRSLTETNEALPLNIAVSLVPAAYVECVSVLQCFRLGQICGSPLPLPFSDVIFRFCCIYM